MCLTSLGYKYTWSGQPKLDRPEGIGNIMITAAPKPADLYLIELQETYKNGKVFPSINSAVTLFYMRANFIHELTIAKDSYQKNVFLYIA